MIATRPSLVVLLEFSPHEMAAYWPPGWMETLPNTAKVCCWETSYCQINLPFKSQPTTMPSLKPAAQKACPQETLFVNGITGRYCPKLGCQHWLMMAPVRESRKVLTPDASAETNWSNIGCMAISRVREVPKRLSIRNSNFCTSTNHTSMAPSRPAVASRVS